jgi:hypothetical protein
MTLDLKVELRKYGASESAVKLLDARNDERLLRYVDLFPESIARKGMAKSPTPDGVLEHDDRPLIYLYRADSLAVDPKEAARGVAEAVRSLACRAEGSYLAVVRHGELDVYPVGLLKEVPRATTFFATPDRTLLVHNLASGHVPVQLRQQAAAARSLHKLLYELITHVAKSLRECGSLSITRDCDEVLPLVGRVIFTRFLVDRGIMNRETFPTLWGGSVKPEHAFQTPELAARTCAWLDEKFNGELLPLLFSVSKPRYKDYLAFFDRDEIRDEVLNQLTHVMYRAPDGRLSLDLAWEGVDFAHVPIGLLSEVYEDYAHEFYRDDALRESVRYTPRHIAEFTIAHAFEGLPTQERHAARVLDPACGAGVFLVLTLQRLVAENWRKTGKRPNTDDIRRILGNQIRGYDINQSAITLAALSLYLTALELDPHPFPAEKLKFERLIGTVLHNTRDSGEKYPYDGIVLGSLGKRGDPAPGEPLFDIVTGNPPWTAFDKWGDKKNAFSAYVEKMVRRILPGRRKVNAELTAVINSYQHNDNLPDVAFLWRAIEWARDDGVIALIVAGRLLFKRSEIGGGMRDALFRSLQVTGILNGALMMPLWKKLNQPFCIVFARNRAPKMGDQFTLVTPALDTSPTNEPRMRIDAEARQPIEMRQALARPHLFKVLTRGGRFDIDIIERIQQMLRPEVVPSDDNDDDEGTVERPSRAITIGAMWKLPWTRNLERSGQGYFPVGENTNKQSTLTRTRIAEMLRRGALSLTSDDLENDAGAVRIGLRIHKRQLAQFSALKLYRLTAPDMFDPPLVLFSIGSGESAREIRARLYFGHAPLVYRRNFFGYSCAGHPNAKLLAKLMFCVGNSNLFGYYALLTSAQTGAERRALLKEDINNFPFLLPEMLSPKQAAEIEAVADALDENDAHTWLALNRCINKLYGLSAADEQVMKDTLDTMMPYASASEKARKPASLVEIEVFRAKLRSTLQPLFSPDNQQVTVDALTLPADDWVAFEVSTAPKTAAGREDIITAIASQLAEQEGLSRVIQIVHQGRLRIAIRNQYRYLTVSQARLCAIDIMREHGEVFPIPETA